MRLGGWQGIQSSALKAKRHPEGCRFFLPDIFNMIIRPSKKIPAIKFLIVPGWQGRGLHALLHVDDDQGWWLGHADSP